MLALDFSYDGIESFSRINHLPVQSASFSKTRSASSSSNDINGTNSLPIYCRIPHNKASISFRSQMLLQPAKNSFHFSFENFYFSLQRGVLFAVFSMATYFLLFKLRLIHPEPYHTCHMVEMITISIRVRRRTYHEVYVIYFWRSQNISVVNMTLEVRCYCLIKIYHCLSGIF